MPDAAGDDGVASIGIGLILALVAVLLAREAKGLLIGESADPALIAQIRSMIEGRVEITAVNHVRTVHTAPDAVFVAISADWGRARRVGLGGHLPPMFSDLDVETLTAHARTQVAAFKVPKRIEFLDDLPRNASGKILKRELRDA